MTLTNRKSRALLACMCLSQSGVESRERMAGLLWGDAEGDKAKASLRQAIYEVRSRLEAAGFDGFSGDNLSLHIDLSRVATDLNDVTTAVAESRVHPLLLENERLIEGLLQGLDDIDPGFESWIVARREVIGRNIIRALENIVQTGPLRGAQVKDAARALLNLDPTHEKAVRALMRILTDEGDNAGALKVYKRLWDLLDEDFDIEPSEETQRLVAEIKLAEPMVIAHAGVPVTTKIDVVRPFDATQAPTKPAQSQPPEASPRIVLAIAKFEMASSSSEHGYILQAFRREMISQLVRFREWMVRDLAFGAGSEVPNSSEYLLEATALEQNGAARIVVTLMDAQTGDYLWSERLPVELDAWYETLHEIVRRLASQLNVYISAGRLSAIVRQPSANLRAYDMWLKAQTRLFNWSPEEGHAAEDLLKRIISEVPDFAPAYSSLASFSGNVHFYHPGFMRTLERHRYAREYAIQAVRLDPIDSRGHLSLGWAEAFLGQFEEANAHHALALELNDSDPWILTSLAISDAFCRDAGDAARLCSLAFDASPSPSPSQWGYRAQVGYVCQDYADAATSASLSTAVHYIGWKAAALARSGETEQARQALSQFYASARARWYGTSQATPEAIVQWFLHLHPLNRRRTWQDLREGLELAGAPRVEVPFFD
ncbi:MAG: BTAD domain-containing putative transcriptional regulator [Hyphomicrobiaceae bacterium]